MTSAEFSDWISYFTLNAAPATPDSATFERPVTTADQSTDDMIAALKAAAPSNVGKVPH